MYLLAHKERAEKERGRSARLGRGKVARRGRPSFWRVTAITFGVVAVAEFGDITQVLIANLDGALPGQLAVFSGAAAGFALVSVVGVLAGRTITRLGAPCPRPASLGPGPSGLRHLSLVSLADQLSGRRHATSSHVSPSRGPERSARGAAGDEGLHARRGGSRPCRPCRAGRAGGLLLRSSRSAPIAGARPSIWPRASPGRSAAPAPAVIFSVDHHRGSEENQPGWSTTTRRLVDLATGRIDTLPFWRRAVEAAGAEDLAVAVVGDSPAIAARLDVAAGLVFIDGGHGEAPAWADYRGWAPPRRGRRLARHPRRVP